MTVQRGNGFSETSAREWAEWLDELAAETGLDRDRAADALRGVLHAIRDEITVRQSGRFASELPVLIRGIFFEGWEPGRTVADHNVTRFVDRVRAAFPDGESDRDYRALTVTVMRTLARRMPEPWSQIKRGLPKELQSLTTPTIAEETLERHEHHVAEERLAKMEALHAERGSERGAPMAPHQNRPPGEQHRGGPLPNEKK